MVRQNCQRREQTERRESLSGDFHGESGESQPTKSRDDAEVCQDFWSGKSNFLYPHQIEPRIQLFVLKEATLFVSLKDIDVYEVNAHRSGRQRLV